MVNLEKMSLFKGLSFLSSEKAEVLTSHYQLVCSVFLFLKKHYDLWPETFKNSFSYQDWVNEVTTQKESLQKEIAEFTASVSHIITEPINFNFLYKQITQLRKKHLSLNSSNSFILTPDMVSQLNQLLILLKDETDPLFQKIQELAQEKGTSIIVFIETVLKKQVNEASIYKNFLQNLLSAAITSLVVYLYNRLNTLGISITGEESLADLEQIILDKKLLAEFKLAATTLGIINGGLWKLLCQQFKEQNDLKEKIDLSLKEHKGVNEITRMQYLCQGLDHACISSYIEGYCEFDSDAWLLGKALSRDAFVKPVKPKCDTPFLLGPSHYLYTDKSLDQNAVLKVTAQLVDDLEKVFQDNMIMGIKITIGLFIAKEGHTIAIKKIPNRAVHNSNDLNDLTVFKPKITNVAFNYEYQFRDSNQGVFIFRDLKSLKSWLPQYIEIMGYQNLIKSYHLEFMPNFLCNRPQGFHYQYVQRNFKRLLNFMTEPLSDVMNYIRLQFAHKTSIDELDILLLGALSLEDKFSSYSQGCQTFALSLFEGNTQTQAKSKLALEMNNEEENIFDKFNLDENIEECLQLLENTYHLPEEARRYRSMQLIYDHLVADTKEGADPQEEVRKKVEFMLTELSSLTTILHPDNLEKVTKLNNLLDKKATHAEICTWLLFDLAPLVLNELLAFQWRVGFLHCREQEQSVLNKQIECLHALHLHTGLPSQLCQPIVDYLSPFEDDDNNRNQIQS